MTLLPDRILRRIDPAERRALGKAGRTIAECEEKNSFENERKLHNQFIGWLRRNGFGHFYHSNPVKRSTIEGGLPDFGIPAQGRILFGEFKVKPNGLSAVQARVFNEMRSAGNEVQVWHTYQEAVLATKEFFGLP
jgi:hypothetical protein